MELDPARNLEATDLPCAATPTGVSEIEEEPIIPTQTAGTLTPNLPSDADVSRILQQASDPNAAVVRMAQPAMECQQQMAKLQLLQMEFQREPAGREAAKALDSDTDVWRNVRLSDLDSFTGRNDSLLPTTWLRAVAKYAKHKSLPESLWTELATMKLDGRIATQWEG